MRFFKLIPIIFALNLLENEISCQLQITLVQWRNVTDRIALLEHRIDQLELKLLESVELSNSREQQYLQDLDDLIDIDSTLNNTLIRLERKVDVGLSNQSPGTDLELRAVIDQLNRNFTSRFQILNHVDFEVHRLIADSTRYNKTINNLNLGYAELSYDNEIWRTSIRALNASFYKVEELSKDSEVWRKSFESMSSSFIKLNRDNDLWRRNFRIVNSTFAKLKNFKNNPPVMMMG